MVQHLDIALRTVYDLKPTLEQKKTRQKESFPDLKNENKFWEVYEKAKPFSMVMVDGFWNVWSSIKYVAERRIPGDFVECGCFLGGVSIFAALALEHFGLKDRRVWMFDTFEGFTTSVPDPKDGLFGGVPRARGATFPAFADAVRQNIIHCGVAESVCQVVVGPVEKTLYGPALPNSLSVLRLDTDLYASTKVELDELYPRLSQHGVLIIDDYGMWEGARAATDEYFAGAPPLLQRLGPSLRCTVKT